MGILHHRQNGMKLTGSVSAGILHAEHDIVISDLIHVGQVTFEIGHVLVGLRNGMDKIQGIGLSHPFGIVDVSGGDHGRLSVAHRQFQVVLLPAPVGHGNIVGSRALCTGFVEARHIGRTVRSYQAIGAGKIASRLQGIGDRLGASRHGSRHTDAQGKRRQGSGQNAAHRAISG